MSTDVSLNTKDLFPRFLTAYKIAVLTICKTYCLGIVPDDIKMKVMLPVLRFIDGDASSFKGILDSDIYQIKELVGSVPTTMPDCTLYQVVLKSLWELDSPNELQNFFLDVEKHMESPATELGRRYFESQDKEESKFLVSDGSIMDQFFRKCVLAFLNLSFDGVIDLWMRLRAMLEPSRGEWDSFNMEDDMVEISPLAHLAEQALAPRVQRYDCMDIKNIGVENIDALLEHCNHQMVKYGMTVDKRVLNLLHRLVRCDVGCPPDTYSVLYLDACQKRDQTQAIEHLHRYFDYSQNLREQNKYQLALFNLAVVYNELYCEEESLRAAEEAIAVAREDDDTVSLATITIWLHRFVRCHPRHKMPDFFADKQQLLQFIQNRAKHHMSLELAFVAQQFESQQLLSAGECPQSLMESNFKCSNLLVMANDVLFARKLHALQHDMWSRYAVHELASTYVDITMESFPEKKPNCHNYLEAVSAKSLLQLRSGKFSLALDTMMRAEDMAKQSLLEENLWLPQLRLLRAEMAIVKGEPGEAEFYLDQVKTGGYNQFDAIDEIRCLEIRMHLEAGNYQTARDITLEAIDEHLSRISTDVTFQCQYLNLFVRGLIRSGNPSRAYTASVRSFDLSRKYSNIQVALEAVTLHGEILVSIKRFDEAFQVVQHHMPAIIESGDCNIKGEAYLVLAKAVMGYMSTELEMKQCRNLMAKSKQMFEAGQSAHGKYIWQQTNEEYEKLLTQDL